MARKDITSFNVSGNLKTAMVSAGYQAETMPEPGRQFYNGSAQNRTLCLEQPPNIPGFRTVEINNNAVEFDFVDFSDAVIIRTFSIRELEVFIGQLPGVQGSTSSLDGSTWTHIISINGTTYTATDTKQVDAMAKALRDLLNAQQQFLRQQ
jgi:hypothetical protein